MLVDVVGQDDAVHFFRRVVSRDLVSPMLLVGDEGVGRRFAVLQLTKELFCTGQRQSGCTCFDCSQIDEGVHPDLVVITASDDKEIGIDQMREVVESASSYPSIAPVKVFLIDGADRMTPGAANALLKTLEEPPSTVRFFLLAENDARVIPTIRSRCGRVRFNRLPETFVLARVQQFESDPTRALVYARMAEGSVGRAIRFWGSGKLGLRDRVLSVLDSGVQGDVPALLSLTASLDKELPLSLMLLEQLLHDLLMLQYDPSRMIHLDLRDSLSQLQPKLMGEARQRLVGGLRALNARVRSSRINVLFHVQTYLVESFLGS